LIFIELYRRLDFSIIPLKARSKEPVIKWSEFETRKATEEELKQWFSKEDVNVGIVCGSVSGNLAVLDFESREAFARFFEKTPDELADSTLVVKTARGYHLYVKTDKPISSFKIPELQLDVKGEGGYVAAPPSIHPTGIKYEFLGNPWKLNHVLSINDLDQWIWDRAGGLGIFKYGAKEDPPCVRMILNGVEEGMRNEAAVRLASYWFQFRKLESREVFNRLLEWNQRNSPPMDEKELKNCLESVLKHGYEYGCSSMVELGLCNDSLKSMCNLKEGFQVKKKNVKYVPSAVLQDGRLIEEAYRDGKVFFIIYDPKTEAVSELEEVEDEEIIYRPVENRDVETGQVMLPSMVEEYGEEKALFHELVEFIDYWHEQPNRFERIIDVLYVFLSWIYDTLPELAYRRALGRWGSGKSAWLETVGSICYRPVILAGCDSEASLRRTFDLWRGTALIDEADFNNSNLYSSIVKILNIGKSKDAGWYRCCNEKDPKIIDSFYVYCPKLLATRGEFKDVALESRCLTFTARKGSGEAPLFRAERFKAEALKLRNKLLLWRFRNHERISKTMQGLEERGLFKSMFNSATEPRIAQIVLPLCFIFEDEDLKRSLKVLVEEKTEQMKTLDQDVWLEEEVPKKLKEIVDAGLAEEVKKTETRILGAVEKEEVRGVTGVTGLSGRGGFFRIRFKELAERLLSEDEKNDKKKVGSINSKLARFLRNHGFIVRKETGNLSYIYVPHDFLKTEEPPPNKTPNTPKPVTQSSEEIKGSEESKQEIILSEDNFQALFEAVKSYGADYWSAEDVVDDFVRAGGRDFYRLLSSLSSREWFEKSPAFWLEQHPNVADRFRLRRR
jgi:hypothetical protein